MKFNAAGKKIFLLLDIFSYSIAQIKLGLAYRMDLSTPTVSHWFHEAIEIIAFWLKFLIQWPESHDIIIIQYGSYCIVGTTKVWACPTNMNQPEIIAKNL